MITKLRLFLRENKFLFSPIYRSIRWLMLDVFKFKQRRMAKYGYQAVDLIHKAAREVGISYFADCGTLLGFIRERGFIPHDMDIDFSIMPETGKVAEFYNALLKRGFYFERYILLDDKLREFTVRYKEVNIDFFQRYFDKTNDFFEVICDKNEDFWPLLKKPAPKNFSLIQIHGASTVVPSNYEEMLQSMYGDWRVPVKEWNDNMAPKYEKDYGSHRTYLSRNEDEWVAYLNQTQSV